MPGGFGQPSFGGIYGGRLGGGGTQSAQTGGPDYNVSPLAGGTAETPASSQPSADEVKAGFLGHPLSWWLIIAGLLVGMSLLGGKR